MKMHVSRGEFLKLSGLVISGIGLKGFSFGTQAFQWESGLEASDGRMGRVAWLEPINVRAQAKLNSPIVAELQPDAIVPWLRELIGYHPYQVCQRWVETDVGYVWSPFLQPVYNRPNEAVLTLEDSSLGPGMWVEVTVPYVNVVLENQVPYAPSIVHRIETGQPPRLYYQQVIWVDKIQTDEQGKVWYRLNERYSYGDIFWGPAEAFRPISRDELAAISPEVENKRIDVNLARQELYCFEDEREVYYCRVSTGAPGEDTETSPGDFSKIFRKMVSMHMSGGTSGAGWDLPGVGFTSLFRTGGIAIHSTFWHNNYGERTSAGCVNVRPQDAKWIFRWSSPYVPYDPGDVEVTDFSGTNVRVLEG